MTAPTLTEAADMLDMLGGMVKDQIGVEPARLRECAAAIRRWAPVVDAACTWYDTPQDYGANKAVEAAVDALDAAVRAARDGES